MVDSFLLVDEREYTISYWLVKEYLKKGPVAKLLI
jgi:hypothetical protein